MTQNRKVKKLAREWAEMNGISYTHALRQITARHQNMLEQIDYDLQNPFCIGKLVKENDASK